jgi:hypothetical protein
MLNPKNDERNEPQIPQTTKAKSWVSRWRDFFGAKTAGRKPATPQSEIRRSADTLLPARENRRIHLDPAGFFSGFSATEIKLPDMIIVQKICGPAC